MISVKEIKQKGLNQYRSFLKSLILFYLQDKEGSLTEKQSFFPLEIRADKGSPKEDIKKRIAELQEIVRSSKNMQANSYTLETEDVLTRNNGKQTVIKRIYFETEKDYITFIGKTKETKRFSESLQIINNELCRFINIQTWAETHLLELCNEQETDFWHNICLCVLWLLQNPQSNLFIREIPVSVHTKFIEENKNLIQSFFLIDTIQVDKNLSFEKYHGLKEKPFLFSFRLLYALPSFIDTMDFPQCMTLSVSDLNSLLSTKSFEPIKNIFIVENEMVYLSFPNIPQALCIWGHGYDVLRLKNCSVLKNKRLLYSGDIDEHGYDILSKFRIYFPQTESFCMDFDTYEFFKEFAVSTKIKLTGETIPKNLTKEELSVFQYLSSNTEKNRLEQERFTQEYIVKKLKKMLLF